MVESTQLVVYEPDQKWAVLIACSFGKTPVPQVITNLEYMERFIGTLDFEKDKVRVFKEEEATKEAIDKFFDELYAACEKHRGESSGKKFLFVVFYSGHGWNVNALQSVTLADTRDFGKKGMWGLYPLELNVRKFKNNFPTNSYTLCVFETCRGVEGAEIKNIEGGVVLGDSEQNNQEV